MSAVKHISLSKLQSLIKRKLEEALPLPCWVTAEISELKVNYSGHCYLELVEKGGDNGVPCAKAGAVIWRNAYGMILSFFRSETGSDLAVGMNVLMKVTVSYHELYGLTLVVTDIDPLYTLGDMERQRQKTIARLKEEGVFDMNRSLPAPAVMQRIAVVSSRNAAGFQDFMNELALSPYRFEVELFDSFMQGHGAEESVIEALGHICDRGELFDIVVVIRGGGSQSDLAAFDSYRLCSHIAQFPLPVVTGIGHDKDQSVADLVSAVALKTPTAVARFLIDSMDEADSWLASALSEVTQLAVELLEEERRQVRENTFGLSHAVSGLTRSVERRLEKLASEISGAAAAYLASSRFALQSAGTGVEAGARAVLAGEKQRLGVVARLVESRDPKNILTLGFAVVRKDGRAIVDASAVAPGDLLEVALHRGTVSARAEQINAKTK